MNMLHEIGPHGSGLEQLRAMLETEGGRICDETAHIRLIEVDDGCVLIEGTPQMPLDNALGTIHGGFAAAMLDCACGFALVTKLVTGQGLSTLEITIAYHEAITTKTGQLRAEGKIIAFGDCSAFTEARLTDMEGKLYASATSSLLVRST